MLSLYATAEVAEARRRRLQAEAANHRLAAAAKRRPWRTPAKAARRAQAPVPAPVERVAVRPMRPADLGAVRRLLQVHGNRAELHGFTPVLGVVALVEDEVVGVAVSYTSFYREGGSELAVLPEWLGVGVGRFLARALARELLAAQSMAGAA